MAQALSRRDIVRVVTRALLDEPAQRSVWLRRLAAYLVLYGKTDEVDVVLNDIAHELQVQDGVVTVEVVSARALSKELRSAVQNLLLAQTGARKVLLHEMIDDALIGGFVARTADAEIDASVKMKLKQLAALA